MTDRAVLLQGDCLEMLKELPDNSVDSLITDPPAGIAFMSREWDEDKGGRKEWIAWMASVMAECLRVMKPGAHGLVWSLPRTSHWTGSALEDAGFEIRDTVHHLFGSGFPKSMNLQKVLGDVAQGQGTALKPAHEVWWLVRKPTSEKTVAANVLKHGTGGINIDASRIKLNPGETTHGSGANQGNKVYGEYEKKRTGVPNIQSTQGRFPANLVLSHNDDCVEVGTKKVKLNGSGVASPKSHGFQTDYVGGDKKSEGFVGGFSTEKGTERVSAFECTEGCAVAELDRQSVGPKADSGGASRFFYCAKASKLDKGEGNGHPTPKSTKLMSYLITLITPPGGIVLDPFLGSGSTGVAAVREGFDFIGIEKEEEYFKIAEKRINSAA